MKDEAYVKELLSKFGETIDCYQQELKTKKYKRMYGILTDYNKNDSGVKNAVIQMQNIHSCFESEELTKMSAGCNGGFMSRDTHSHNPTYEYSNDFTNAMGRPRLGKTTKGISGI